MNENFPERNSKPLILIVDDIPENVQVVAEILYMENYEIAMAQSGAKALSILEEIVPDLVLLDIIMPDMDGYEVCERIKSNPRTKDVPVIFLTAKSDIDDLIKGFEIGGMDYVTKPFNRKELLIRIKTQLELKFSRDIIEEKIIEIEQKNLKLVDLNAEKDKYLNIVNSELKKAADYVVSLLPPPLQEENLQAEWKFMPSAQLGGDALGYKWLDSNYFVFYVLDVCGHGIGSALHSVSVLNSIKFQTLSGTDYKLPQSVFNSLNQVFQMTKYNDLYFTIWYGVYNKKTKTLKYASAGHPPAFMVPENGEPTQLIAPNCAIGGLPEYDFQNASVKITEPTNLYLYTDGVFEIRKSDGTLFNIEELHQFLMEQPQNGESEIELLYRHLQKLCKKENLRDDFTILKISFE